MGANKSMYCKLGIFEVSYVGMSERKLDCGVERYRELLGEAGLVLMKVGPMINALEWMALKSSSNALMGLWLPLELAQLEHL
jgi:hypothetical protein